MKFLLTFLFLFVTFFEVISQEVLWVRAGIRNDDNNGVYSLSVCFDNNKSIINAGYYYCTLSSTIKFDVVTISGFQNPSFLSHGYFAKYNSNGDISWVNRIGGTDGNTKITGITTDNSGNIYIVGDFTQTCKFGCPQTGDCFGLGTAISSLYGHDIFIAKYDNNGNFIWVKTINSSTNSIYAEKILYDNNNSIIVTGKFSGTTVFGEGMLQTTLVATGSNDVFIASYSLDGDLNWVNQGESSNWCEINGLEIDQNGNIFIVGVFNGSINFDTFNLLGSGGAGSTNPYIVKFDNSGNIINAVSYSASNDVRFTDLACDLSDNSIYITGYLSGNINFGSTTLNSEFGNNNTLIGKLDNDLSFVWAKKTGLRPDNLGGSSGISIAGKNSGFYLIGNYTRECVFEVETLTNNNNQRLFFSEWDEDGNLINIESAGGTNMDYAKYIVSTPDEVVAIASDSYGTTTFYPPPTYQIFWGSHIVTINRTSAITSKVKYCTPIQIISQPQPANSEICPGEEIIFSIDVTGTQPINYQWYNSSGMISGADGSSFTANNADTYYCIVTNDCSSVTSDNVTLNLKTLSQAPTLLTFSPDAICANTVTLVTFTATGGLQGSGAVLEWFFDSCNGTILGTGNPLTVEVNFPASPQIFARYSGDCNTTNCFSQSLHLDPGIPDDPFLATASRTSICPDDNGTIILRLLGAPVDQVFWYTEECGTGLVATGNPTSVPSPGNTTTYYGRYENACGVSACQSVTVTVVPYPTTPTSISADLTTVCSDYQELIALSVENLTDDQVFWYADSCGGDVVNTGNIIFITVPDSTTVFYARTENMCGESDCVQIEITVIPRADASISNPGLLCSADEPIQIIAAEDGGIWGGDFIDPITGIFDLNQAGGGQHLISYTIEGLCGDYDEIILDVVQAFDPTISFPGILCIFNDSTQLQAATPGGTWSGFGIINDSLGVFNPSLVGIGIHRVYYESADFCGGIDSIDLVVIGKIEAEITTQDFYCNNIDTVYLTAEPFGGFWTGTNVEPDGTFLPSITEPGMLTIEYTIPGECGDTVQKQIFVYEKIFANITSSPNLCIRDTIIQLTGTPPGGLWIGEGVNPITGVIDMSELSPGAYDIIYAFFQDCGDIDTVSFTIHPFFDTHIWYEDSIYHDGLPVTINRVQDGGVWQGIGINENGIFDPAISSFGEFMIIYSYNDGFCPEADTIILKVHFRPYADLVIPTVITPNSDNHNDYWDIKALENYEIVKIKIYTRWGDEVFSYSGSGEGYRNPSNAWNGKYKGRDLPTGGYLYILEIDNQVQFKGTISLIR